MPRVCICATCVDYSAERRKGEIVEGAEDDIRATYYILAFQREFSDDEAELRWRVVDMMVVGGESAYIECVAFNCNGMSVSWWLSALPGCVPCYIYFHFVLEQYSIASLGRYPIR